MKDKPKVGENVQFFPGENERDFECKSNNNPTGPVAAQVTRSFPDNDMLNLVVFPDYSGQLIIKGSIHHKSGAAPGFGYWDFIDQPKTEKA